MEISEEILGAALQQGGPEERALRYVTGCRQFNPANINTYGDLLMLNFWREKGDAVQKVTVGYETVVEFILRNPELTIYYSTEMSFNRNTFPETKFHSIPLHLFQPSNTPFIRKPLMATAKEKLKPPLQKALKHVQNERDEQRFLDELFRRRPDLRIPNAADTSHGVALYPAPVIDGQQKTDPNRPPLDDTEEALRDSFDEVTGPVVEGSDRELSVPDNMSGSAAADRPVLVGALSWNDFLDHLFVESNPDSFPMVMDHESLRTRMRRCVLVRDFLPVYESSDFMRVLSCLREAQEGHDREEWAKAWAGRLADRDPWATALNDHRATVSVYLFELCDRWQNRNHGDSAMIATDIINDIGDTKIKQMVKLTLVMDRAKALYSDVYHHHHDDDEQNKDRVSRLRGRHWFSDQTAHQEILAEQGVFVSPSHHTMNKRYLWLMKDPAFADLGLWRDPELQKWVTPESAPLLNN